MTAREWTKREDKFLHKYRMAMSVEDIAEALKRTIEDVENRMVITDDKKGGYMGITQERKGKKWTEQEDRFILENHDELTTGEIARVLKRTVAAINSRKFKLLNDGKNFEENKEKKVNEDNKRDCKILDDIMFIYGNKINADIAKKISTEAQKRNFRNVRELSELAIKLEDWKGGEEND